LKLLPWSELDSTVWTDDPHAVAHTERAKLVSAAMETDSRRLSNFQLKASVFSLSSSDTYLHFFGVFLSISQLSKIIIS
jgi:hypothetical protein